jgi:hypothetical protein
MFVIMHELSTLMYIYNGHCFLPFSPNFGEYVALYLKTNVHKWQRLSPKLPCSANFETHDIDPRLNKSKTYNIDPRLNYIDRPLGSGEYLDESAFCALLDDNIYPKVNKT